jgi:formate dehydrogenase maturation protein FdhE
MRCSCCDNPLSDKEATAKFVNEDPKAPVRYVEMCKKCQSYLPDSVRILNRNDLEDELQDNDLPELDFDKEENNDGYEE